jgi:glycosyltransferase involved in cell wall biosynthesis
MKIAIVNLITRTPTNRKVPAIDSNKDAMIVKLALELKALGHEIVLYVSDLYQPVEAEDLGFEVVYLKTYLTGLPEIPFVPSLVGHLRNRFDVVLTSETFQWATIFSVIARLLSFKLRPKVFVWHEISMHQRACRQIPSKFFHLIVLRYFLDWQIHCYIPRGMRAKNFLLQQGVSGGKVTDPISHGVDQNNFFHERISANKDYIFSPSRLVADKDIPTILKAFHTLRHHGVDVDLVIQGDGPDYDACKEMAINLKIEQFVFFNRTRVNHDQMRKLYSNAQFTVIASKQDFMLFSIMESLICKTPVIVSDAIDISDEISMHGGGLVFACGNHEMLFKQMISFWQNNSQSSLLNVDSVQENKYRNSTVAIKLMNVFEALC